MSQLPGSVPALPFFLDCSTGQRFCLYHPPVGACRGAVLYVHPFGEEMNKSRRMVAQQARALSSLGYGVLQIDLHGCGDSSGDFADARWEAWLADIGAGVAWLRHELDQPVSLWGLRLGALLALEYAATAEHPIARLVLWQPVHSGTTFLKQFLRLRVASDMAADRKGGGTDELRAALLGGESLEIAGYELAPELALALEGRDAARLPVSTCPVYWLDVVADAERPFTPASSRVIDAWRQAGVDAEARTAVGQAFWATQEITECPQLLNATCAIFAGAQA